MFDNIVLDIFIGLVLIYLLYSLFITIVSEMIVTWMALRSRVLRVAIEKMLNDGMHNRNYPARNRRQRWWNIIQRYFLKEFEDFKGSLAGKFYASPSIKYLSDNGGEHRTSFSQTKPSYISADMFAETLMQLLKDKGTGATDLEKIKFCLKFNTHHIELSSLKNLRDLAENSGDDINLLKTKLIASYNETMDRATGWYKRRLQLILFWLGLIVAIAFNVDTIQIAKILSKDDGARNELVTMGIELSKDSARYQEFTNGKIDSVHTKTILDSGYARVTQDIKNANMVLGLGWPLANLVKKDKCCFERKKDSTLFEILEEYKSFFNGFDSTLNVQYGVKRADKKAGDSLVQKLLIYKYDTAVFRLQQADDTLAITRVLINSTIARLNIIEARSKKDSAELVMLMQKRNDAIRQINAHAAVNFFLIDSIKTDTANKKIIVYTQRPYSTPEKIRYVLGKFNPFSPDFWSFLFSLQFLGLFITALMLSLGAPFWFDLLKKLVAIRGTGVKPEEKQQLADPKINNIPIAANPVMPVNIPTPVNIAGDAFDEAIKIYGAEIRNVPGVKSVFKVFDNVRKKSSIQINVIDAITQMEVSQKYAQLKVGNFSIIPVIIISGTPETQQSNDGEISNASGKNGFGATGCVLQDVQTKKLHILSCWHVMKGNIDYDNDDTDTTMLDHENKNLASRWAGGIAGSVDFAIAECFKDRVENNQELKKQLALSQFEYRIVSDQEINNQIGIKYYDWSAAKVQAGKIYTCTPFLEVHYKDKIRVVEDILVLTNLQGNSAISQPGNSGSIIFDDKGAAIGMIIAGDLFYSYAIKLSNIFSLHQEMEILKG